MKRIPFIYFALSFCVFSLLETKAQNMNLSALPYMPSRNNLNIFMIDVNGKKIEQDFVQTMEAGERFLAINTSNYPNGKYFCTIEHDGIAETISFVIQK